MSRLLLRSALELRSPATRLPPAFLQPIHARWIATTPHLTEPIPTSTTSPLPPLSPANGPSLEASRSQKTSADIHAKAAAAVAAAAAATSPTNTASPSTAQSSKANTREPPTTQPPQPTGPIPQVVKELLPLLRSQPSHYITIHIHGRPYLVTLGDSVRLPFQMPGILPGDVLRLNRASVLGSRDFTLKPTNLDRKPGSNEPAYIDERLYECRATVIGVETEPMRLKEKTKRRNRKVKTVRSKHRYTVLRISELKVKAPEELDE